MKKKSRKKYLNKYKINLMEFAGAFGDIGTFIPLFMGLTVLNIINPSMTLLLVGSLYIFNGLYYKLPIPVQPLKAAAAIAIALNLDISTFAAGGILMGIILLILGLTGLSVFLEKIFVLPIVRGIQLGIGLILMKSSAVIIYNSIILTNTIRLFPDKFEIPLNLILLIFGISIILISFKIKKIPVSIILLASGILINIFTQQSNKINFSLFSIQSFNINIPSLNNFWNAFVLLIIPQLPLTLGNAIIATKNTAKKYFKDRAKKVTVRVLPISMGATNLLAGITGSMPVCHGSGGLTAHYSYGARGGKAVLIIGIVFVSLSLLFGPNVNDIFKFIPKITIGIMLFYIGLRHALFILDLTKIKDIILAIGIGITALIIKNLGIAYLVGMIIYYLPYLLKRND